MSKTIRSFTDLNVWKEGHKLVITVCLCTQDFPRIEAYSLVDQMRRSAISVTSNIAEGFGRQTYKEKVQFYYLAQGSLTELKNQILIAKDLKFLNDKNFKDLVFLANTVHKLLHGLIKKSKSFLNQKS